MLSSLIVFIESAFNPYMNNPIGMSMLLISIAVLKVLGIKKYEQQKGNRPIKLHERVTNEKMSYL